jgi:hypothetical protein
MAVESMTMRLAVQFNKAATSYMVKSCKSGQKPGVHVLSSEAIDFIRKAGGTYLLQALSPSWPHPMKVTPRRQQAQAWHNVEA